MKAEKREGLMTEAEWLAAGDRTVNRLVKGMDARRQRLFAAACCRQLGALVADPVPAAALDAVEQYADTGKSKAALARHRLALRHHRYANLARTPGLSDALTAVEAAATENDLWTIVTLVKEALRTAGSAADAPAFRRLYVLYRDLTGRPAAAGRFAAGWRTADAVTIARRAYETREFPALPVLADALEDAGCDDADMLARCRSEGPHARGCWLVDLVLAKE
jgi:hypothetical protein